MSNARAYAASSATAPLAPVEIERREPGQRDVEVDVLFCGVCHSDLHTARGEWEGTLYPCVPGHEIVGRVARTGVQVTRHRTGDLVAVGCMVDSCRTCPPCRRGLEPFCEPGATFTYNSPDPHLGAHTLGGYSTRIVVDEAFVLRVPAGLDPAAAAPLLCAGITTYSPLRHFGAGPGRRVGVVGLGGLGHMGVKLARAMGAEVVLFTTSPGKADDARRLGASEVVISKDAAAMERCAESLDLVLDTVSAPHDLAPYLDLLRLDGTLVLVGVPSQPLALPAFSLIARRRRVAGSLIGGIAETQELLDLCAARGIAADVERIPMSAINDAYERLVRQDVRYRFVVDMSSLRA